MNQAEQVKQQATAKWDDFRARHPRLDHLVRTVQHYGSVKGNNQAGAVTYFGFLSFFPILALAFAVVGQVAKVYPDAQDRLLDAISEVLPDLVSEDGAGGTIALSDVQGAAAAAFGIGLVGVLYSGLGWLSALRDALVVVFEMPQREQPNFLLGKAKDLLTLVVIGFTLIVSVAVAGVVAGLSDRILEWVGLGVGSRWALVLVGIAVGLAANSLLFFTLFRLLAHPHHVPARALWSGALLGAVGFEVLKQVSTYLIAATQNQPAFQAFGIALILLVWINYFSRVVIYAAAWAYTHPRARALRDGEEASGSEPAPTGDSAALAARVAAARAADVPAHQPAPRRDERVSPRAALAAGAVGGAALAALVSRFRRG